MTDFEIEVWPAPYEEEIADRLTGPLRDAVCQVLYLARWCGEAR